MITVERYTKKEKDNWNTFNRSAKNPLFMFDRDYMDYHKDRFQDHSLLFYQEGELIAILPMSEKRRSAYIAWWVDLRRICHRRKNEATHYG